MRRSTTAADAARRCHGLLEPRQLLLRERQGGLDRRHDAGGALPVEADALQRAQLLDRPRPAGRHLHQEVVADDPRRRQVAAPGFSLAPSGQRPDDGDEAGVAGAHLEPAPRLLGGGS